MPWFLFLPIATCYTCIYIYIFKINFKKIMRVRVVLDILEGQREIVSSVNIFLLKEVGVETR
jgi:hypothetical protein